MDVIFIRDLRIATLIGVFDWERRIRQTVVLDLEMATDCRRAAEQDDLADALDYKAVSKRIIGFVEESRFELVETLAERVAGIIVEEFGVPWVRLRVNKEGALRGAKDVGVVIERGERGS
jgi:7,8-dihydroneopterin aldolase/epimerase/oxygenase